MSHRYQACFGLGKRIARQSFERAERYRDLTPVRLAHWSGPRRRGRALMAGRMVCRSFRSLHHAILRPLKSIGVVSGPHLSADAGASALARSLIIVAAGLFAPGLFFGAFLGGVQLGLGAAGLSPAGGPRRALPGPRRLQSHRYPHSIVTCQSAISYVWFLHHLGPKASRRVHGQSMRFWKETMTKADATWRVTWTFSWPMIPDGRRSMKGGTGMTVCDAGSAVHS